MSPAPPEEIGAVFQDKKEERNMELGFESTAVKCTEIHLQSNILVFYGMAKNPLDCKFLASLTILHKIDGAEATLRNLSHNLVPWDLQSFLLMERSKYHLLPSTVTVLRRHPRVQPIPASLCKTNWDNTKAIKSFEILSLKILGERALAPPVTELLLLSSFDCWLRLKAVRRFAVWPPGH